MNSAKTDLVLLIPRPDFTIDAKKVQALAAQAATIVAICDPVFHGEFDKESFIHFHHQSGVDMAQCNDLRLRDIVLVQQPADREGCDKLLLYVWNQPVSYYNIDAVRIPWDQLPGTRDRRNNPNGKNPTNLWNDETPTQPSLFELADAPNQRLKSGLRTKAVHRLIRAHCHPHASVHIWADDDDYSLIAKEASTLKRAFDRIACGQPDPLPAPSNPGVEPLPFGEISKDEFTWSHQKASARVMLGDCRPGIQRLPQGTVTHVVTSPPYNINYRSFIEAGTASKDSKRFRSRRSYKDDLSDGQYRSLLQTTFAELDRVASPDGLDVFCNIKNKYNNFRCLPPFYILELIPKRWKLRDLLVWRYDISFDPAKKKYKPIYEWVLRMGFGDVPLPERPIKDWYIPIFKGNSKGRSKLIHPVIFPQKLVQKALETAKVQEHPQALVVDPFLGSGTTLVESLRQGGSGVGFEKFNSYMKDICTRLQFAEPDCSPEILKEWTQNKSDPESSASPKGGSL